MQRTTWPAIFLSLCIMLSACWSAEAHAECTSTACFDVRVEQVYPFVDSATMYVGTTGTEDNLSGCSGTLLNYRIDSPGGEAVLPLLLSLHETGRRATFSVQPGTCEIHWVRAESTTGVGATQHWSATVDKVMVNEDGSAALYATALSSPNPGGATWNCAYGKVWLGTAGMQASDAMLSTALAVHATENRVRMGVRIVTQGSATHCEATYLTAE